MIRQNRRVRFGYSANLFLVWPVGLYHPSRGRSDLERDEAGPDRRLAAGGEQGRRRGGAAPSGRAGLQLRDVCLDLLQHASAQDARVHEATHRSQTEALSAPATTGTDRVQTGSCGVLQRPAEPPRIACIYAVFAVGCVPSQLVRGDKMSDDAKFILGLGKGCSQ